MQLEELSARAEIADLLARYGFYADCGAYEAWIGLFCDNAYMDVPDYASGNEASSVRLTHDKLRASIFDAPVVQAMRGRMQHHMDGPMTIMVNGDTAQVDSYTTLVSVPDPAAGGPATPSVSPSFNRWLLRREDGSWRIAGCIRRRIAQSMPLLQEIAERDHPRTWDAAAPPAQPRVQRVNHVAVSVSDMAVSIAFYTEQLGLELVATQPAMQTIDGLATVVGYDADELKGEWALLAAGADRVELVSYHHPAGRPVDGLRLPADHGLAHLAFQVDDVDGMHARLTRAGVTTVSAPVTLGRHRAFYAYGPDGELLEILNEDSLMPPPATLHRA